MKQKICTFQALCSCITTTASIILFSIMFAVLEQVAVPVPWSPVPIILQPLPLFFLTLFLGLKAPLAFTLYLLHGALGAPIFAFGLGGIARLMGPTGGYLFGMLFASYFLSLTAHRYENNLTLAGKIIIANIIIYSMGLIQLSFYIPYERLLQAGLWPFMPGFLLKTITLLVAMNCYKRMKF